MPRLFPSAAQGRAILVEERSPLWWLRWVPAVILAAAFLYGGYVVGQVAVIPVLASFAIAYVVNPIVGWFELRGLSRAVSAGIALALLVGAVLLFLGFVIPDLWTQSVEAGGMIVRNLNEGNARNLRRELREFSPVLDRIIGAQLYNLLRSPAALSRSAEQFFTGGLAGFITTAAGALDLLIIPFFVYYILVDFEEWRVSFDELIPPRFREPLTRLLDEVGRILQSYVLGQLMIAIIMGVLYAMGFALLGVPAWAGLAALSGLLNVVPYVGTGSGLILASGFAFAESGQIWRVGGVVAVFIVVQSIEGYILTPRILGHRLSLHPMAVFLGLLIGGRLFGLLGVLLAVPVIAIATVFLRFLREIYRSSDFYRAREFGPEPAPRPVEEVIALAADTVLADQVERQRGDELLAPEKNQDDPLASQKP